MERDKQPVEPMVVMVEEEQGLVAVQALVLAVEVAQVLAAVAVQAGQGAEEDPEVEVQAVSKRM